MRRTNTGLAHVAAGSVVSPATTVTGPDTFGAAAVVGTGAKYAREDHDHGLPASPSVPAAATTVTGPDTFGHAAVVGTSGSYARADHDHGLPANPAPTAAASVTGPDAFGAAAVLGASAAYARQDHDHGLPANPVTLAAINSVIFDPLMPMVPFVTGADGILRPLSFSDSRRRYWIPDGNGTSINKAGGPTATLVGTATSDGTPATTNYRTAMGNVMKIPSAATAGSFSELRSADLREMLGAVAGVGGAYVRIKFGIDTLASAADRIFVGYTVANGAPANTDPSSWLNIFGVGADAADTHLQFMVNDGAGAATKTDLGANYPKTAGTNVYLLELGWEPNSTTIYWRVSRLDSIGTAAVSGNTATNVPAAPNLLQWHIWQSNNATAAACGLFNGGVVIDPLG